MAKTDKPLPQETLLGSVRHRTQDQIARTGTQGLKGPDFE